MTTPGLVRSLLGHVSQDRMREDLLYLCQEPLPFRKLNYTLPGHGKSTLEEADEHIERRLAAYGYAIEREAVPVQAYRRDESKPLAHQYSPPAPEDPWYAAHNLHARKAGSTRADEIVVLVAHKDSQSWIDSPGAYDNVVGTIAVMEIARVVSAAELPRSVWLLFCNEEHAPWTSVVAAENARVRGDNLVAVFNLDGLGGKSQEDTDAGRKTNVTAYTTEEGRRIADLMGEVNERYGIGLLQSTTQRPHPNDDDGSFVKAGFGAAVLNIGSFPYLDPAYHTPDDTADRVDLENVWMATRATLAAVVELACG